MPTPEFEALLKRFFVQPNDPILAADDERTRKAQRVPATSAGNTVDFLVDGHAYFGALRQEIAKLLAGAGERFFYMANWHFGLVAISPGPDPAHIDGQISAWDKNIGAVAFRLDDGQPGPTLLRDDLVQLAAQGVDVRALVWVNPMHFTSEVADQAGYMAYNLHSIKSIQWLREQAAFAPRDAYKKLLLNTLCHPLGSMHLKVTVIGGGDGVRAYVSGLDFEASRVAGPEHAGQLWHDAGVRVQGPGALHVYNYYRQLYNEQARRKADEFRIDGKTIVSHYRDTEPIKERTAPPPGAGTQHVQVLRTLPQMNFAPSREGTIQAPIISDIPVLGEAVMGLLTCLFKLIAGYGQDELKFAPDGVFEFRTAMLKAIGQADRYVYIEDQSMYNMELMAALHQRMVANPNLKVIMVHGGDPADPANVFLAHAINRVLVRDRPDFGARIAFWEAAQVMHTKLTIIDDIWAAVGSANAMRRSFYMDGECSIAVMDEAPVTFAHRLRTALWGEHAGILVDVLAEAAFFDLDESLSLWDPAWGAALDGGIKLLPRFQQIHVPFAVSDLAQGKITVTNGAHEVTGQGTNWGAGLVGQSLKVVGDSRVYIITAVDSPTGLRVDLRGDRDHNGYVGPTAANQSYRLTQPGRWLLDELPKFDPVKYAQQDADSRLDY